MAFISEILTRVGLFYVAVGCTLISNVRYAAPLEVTLEVI